MRPWLPVVVIEKTEFGKWCDVGSLALLELSKAKGGSMTGLARVPGGAERSVLLALPPPTLTEPDTWV